MFVAEIRNKKILFCIKCTVSGPQDIQHVYLLISHLSMNTNPFTELFVLSRFLCVLGRWPPGWMTPWAPWPLSWSTVLRLSLSSKENVWYHCNAALSIRVFSWRTASTGGEWKLFFNFHSLPVDFIFFLQKMKPMFVKVWFNSLFFFSNLKGCCAF